MGGCGPTKVRGGGSSVFHILCAMGGLSNFQLILTRGGGGFILLYFKGTFNVINES